MKVLFSAPIGWMDRKQEWSRKIAGKRGGGRGRPLYIDKETASLGRAAWKSSELRSEDSRRRLSPHERCLEAWCSGGRVAVVERDAHAALSVEASGCGPIDVVCTDDAGAATDQGVGDAAIGISVAADR